MLNIENLHMRLPAGYVDQAQTVAQRVAQLLAEIDHSGMSSHKHIVVPVIHVDNGANVDIIATQIAGAIEASIKTYTGVD